MSPTTRLSVNVDHVATLRQARGTPYPSPVEAAEIAEGAGAHGITAHLRVDRRHIQDTDIAALARTVRGKLNLEISTAAAMIDVATAHRPGQVTLVPERPEEVTTEGGLDLEHHGPRTLEVGRRLHGAGIAVSLFLDPEPTQLDHLARLRDTAPEVFEGFEINTDAYTKASRAAGRPEEGELAKVRDAARRGGREGFRVYAGHGLMPDDVGPVAALPEVEELNIGHGLVSRAVLIGLAAAVEEMLEAMARG